MVSYFPGYPDRTKLVDYLVAMIKTAGLYKHFKGKEDMFYYLVKDTLAAFEEVTDSSKSQMEADVNYNPFNL